MAQLADAGGVGAALNGALGPNASHPVQISELLSVSEEAVLALFGTLRAAALRVPPDESATCIKDFNARAKTARTLASIGQPSPQNFFKPIFFFYFQQDHALLLRSLPLDLAKLDAWAYGFGRWSIVANDDVCNGSDFQHMLTDADKIEAQLLAALDVLSLQPATPLRNTLRADANGLITRFCAFRQREVARLVSLAHGLASVAHVLDEMVIIGRAYAYESATIAGFLVQLERALTTQAHGRASIRAKEEFVSRAWISFYRAFLAGLRGAERPTCGAVAVQGEPPTAAGGALAVGPAFSAGFQAAGGIGTIQTIVQAADRHGAGWDLRTLSTPAASPTLSVRSEGQTSLDTMARQVLAGCRTPGAFLGPGNGSAHGIDLPNDYSRLVLFANQIREGSRLPGVLLGTPPASLPEVPPLAAPQPVAGQRWSGGTQLVPARERSGQERAAPTRLSNDIVVPFSSYMLGKYTPYKDLRLPESCYECHAPRSHFGNECPQRFARVLGEAPPGWALDGLAAVRNPAHWEGNELTAAARADYRRFLSTHALPPHRSYPVSADDIAGAAPPPLRRPAGGRGQ